MTQSTQGGMGQGGEASAAGYYAGVRKARLILPD